MSGHDAVNRTRKGDRITRGVAEANRRKEPAIAHMNAPAPPAPPASPAFAENASMIPAPATPGPMAAPATADRAERARIAPSTARLEPVQDERPIEVAALPPSSERQTFEPASPPLAAADMPAGAPSAWDDAAQPFATDEAFASASMAWVGAPRADLSVEPVAMSAPPPAASAPRPALHAEAPAAKIVEAALAPQSGTQLFNPADLDNVKNIQSQYIVKPLSAFLGRPAPKAAPAIDLPKPLSREAQQTSLDVFRILNFGFQFCPTHPTEKALMARIAKIGIGAGKPFDPGKLSPEMKTAIAGGMADAWAEIAELKKRIDRQEVDSADGFGSRADFKNNYLFRMAGAMLGIYGNSKAEAFYPAYFVDADGKQPNGANRYTLCFAPGQLPPVDAFWSLTMYDDPAGLLVANPLNRYLLNSTMLDQFKRDPDGGLTLLIQHESPGEELEANWLPAPKGPFGMILRLYLPGAEALNKQWTQPPLKRVE